MASSRVASLLAARAFSSLSSVAERARLQKLQLAAGTDSSDKLLSSAQNLWTRFGCGFAAAGIAAAVTATAAVAATEETVQLPGGIAVTAQNGAQIQRKVVFVLGGPGSGKGTQCAELLKEFDNLAHYSAGDLLRAHVNSGSSEGNMVADMIKNGQIVPSEVTVGLLKKAIAESGKLVVLIDGFPRNLENRAAFEWLVGYDCSFVLFFDCPEDVLEKRLLSRNQGRVDDNIETIKKRFKVFLDQSLPVIDYYEKLGKVHRVNTNRPVHEIYKDVKACFV